MKLSFRNKIQAASTSYSAKIELTFRNKYTLHLLLIVIKMKMTLRNKIQAVSTSYCVKN
jgi:hypothetical protein